MSIILGPPGVLCPVSLTCNSVLLLQEDDSPHRKTLCTVLIMSRLSIILFYWVILLFSFHFRLFLVLYADRGLVKNGKPNLDLFCKLYWVVIVVLLIFGFAMFHGGNLLKGNFILQDSNRLRACLLGNMPEHSNKIHLKKKAIVYAFIVIAFFRLLQFKIQVKHFILGLCPNGRMSCIGNFKRNAINLNQTFWWSLWWCFASTLCCISVDYGHGYLSSKSQFWIWNMSGFILYEGTLLFLPFFLDVPNLGTVLTPNLEFYVRKPILEPRIRYIPLEEVNTNVSRFINRKKCKNNPGFSRNQVLSRKIWFCQDFNESGTLSEKPRMAGSFQGGSTSVTNEEEQRTKEILVSNFG